MGGITVVGYFVLMLSLLLLFVVLAVRFVRAHERAAAALEQIARKLEGPRSDSRG